MILYSRVVAISLEIQGKVVAPMNLIEILTFGIFLVELIGLILKIGKK